MKERIITALIGILIVIPIILYGSWPFAIAVYLLATIALFELIRMFKIENLFIISLSFIFLWSFIYFQQDYTFTKFTIDSKELIIFYLLILLLMVVFSKNKFTVNDVSRLLFAIYVIRSSVRFTSVFIYFVRHLGNGFWCIFYWKTFRQTKALASNKPEQNDWWSNRRNSCCSYCSECF